ncbi:hypothetical protein ILUMI_23350 [Ignelater luminosus]|uniref:Peptidase S1 domain-containing protein n=1 Tax=Ignelater luminosus TaxID=2038154 RepID=A0A8K0G1Z7_IGNLU|nr:hypothetical protein ILUMI_23350 [Ignelater luminosus]
MLLLTFFSISCFFLLTQQVNAESKFESPCPHLFLHEGACEEPDRWYGVIIILSETDLHGVWLQLTFDKPFMQLGNWFGEVATFDYKEYSIRNKTFYLKAAVPKIVRFYVKYNQFEAAPRLLSFRINAKTVCPEITSNSLMTTENNGSPISEGEENMRNINKLPEGVIIFPDDYRIKQKQPSKDDINAICGTVVANLNEFNTQDTYEGAFPWHAALHYARGNDLVYICGSSLVSKYHVLTAAHCVALQNSQQILNPKHLVVYLGKYYLRQFSRPAVQDRPVSEIILHPQYNPQTYANDIALVKFTAAAAITDYVRPICLWQDSLDFSSVLNKQGNVVGWGFDKTGKATEQLVQTKMSVVSQETCTSFSNFYYQFISSSTYCSKFKDGTSTCNGDSGSGMVFPTANSNRQNARWQLRGLVSISIALQTQFKCDISHYAVFTDIAKYLDWIRKSMK